MSSKLMRGLTITKERSSGKLNLDFDPKTKRVLKNLKVKMTPEEIFALKFMGKPVNKQ